MPGCVPLGWGWGDSRNASGQFAEAAGVQMWIGRLPQRAFRGASW